jgi:hypothetical protein
MLSLRISTMDTREPHWYPEIVKMGYVVESVMHI